jgi:hypothetical protein
MPASGHASRTSSAPPDGLRPARSIAPPQSSTSINSRLLVDAGALFVVRHHPANSWNASGSPGFEGTTRLFRADVESIRIGDMPMPPHAAAGSSLMT